MFVSWEAGCLWASRSSLSANLPERTCCPYPLTTLSPSYLDLSHLVLSPNWYRWFSSLAKNHDSSGYLGMAFFNLGKLWSYPSILHHNMPGLGLNSFLITLEGQEGVSALRAKERRGKSEGSWGWRSAIRWPQAYGQEWGISKANKVQFCRHLTPSSPD